MSVGGYPTHNGPISAYNHSHIQSKQHSIYDELASSADKLVDDSKLYRSQFIDKIYKPMADTIKSATHTITHTKNNNNTAINDSNDSQLIKQSRGHTIVKAISSAATTADGRVDHSLTAEQQNSEQLKKQVMLRSKL